MQNFQNYSFRQSASRLAVRVGNYHLYEDDPDQVDIAVSKVMLHEDYDSWTINNDICLLELDGQADFGSDVIGGINLPEEGKDYPTGTECIVAGWGTTSEGGSLARVLMKVILDELSMGYHLLLRLRSLLSVMKSVAEPIVSLISVTP